MVTVKWLTEWPENRTTTGRVFSLPRMSATTRLISSASVDDGMQEMVQMRCATSLTDRRRTECTSDGRKAQRRAGDGLFHGRPLADDRKRKDCEIYV